MVAAKARIKMSSRAYLNIFLAVVTIILASMLLLDSTPDTATTTQSIAEVKPETIQSIRIERTDKDDIHLIKTPEHWRISSPIQVRANTLRVNSILSLLQSPVVSQIPADPGTLADFGLAAPEISLYLGEMEFQFGYINALDKSRYIKHGDKIVLLDDFLYPQLRQETGFFVNTKLFYGPLKSVHISCSDGTAKDIELSGSDEMLNAWERLDAVSVSTTAPLTRKMADVLIMTEQEDKLRIIVSQDGDSLVLKPSEVELYYRVPQNHAGSLGLVLAGCVVQDA